MYSNMFPMKQQHWHQFLVTNQINFLRILLCEKSFCNKRSIPPKKEKKKGQPQNTKI